MRATRREVLSAAVALLVPALAVIGVFAAVVAVNRDALDELGRGESTVDERLLPALRSWRDRVPSTPQTHRGAFFGDSIVADVDLPALVAHELAQRGVDVDLASVAHQGLLPLHYYCLLDQVLAGRPEVAVVSLNLPAVSRRLWGVPPLARMARLLSPARAWRIRGLLARGEINLLDPWIYRVEDRLGALHVVDGLRELGRRLSYVGGDARSANVLQMRESVALGTRRDLAERRNRQDDALATNPTLAVIRELVAALREAGVRPVLYLTPVDTSPEHLASWDIAGDDASLTTLVEDYRRAIGAAPEEWIDLHALLRSDERRDRFGHLRPVGADHLAAVLADALAARLQAPSTLDSAH